MKVLDFVNLIKKEVQKHRVNTYIVRKKHLVENVKVADNKVSFNLNSFKLILSKEEVLRSLNRKRIRQEVINDFTTKASDNIRGLISVDVNHDDNKKFISLTIAYIKIGDTLHLEELKEINAKYRLLKGAL